MKKFREYGIISLCGLVLVGCSNKNLELVVKEQAIKITQPYKKVSYKLEDLCDTGLYEKDITLKVYIEPSEVIWDYHKYKEEIFRYVKKFFKEQSINCNITYSSISLKKFTKPNEFGLEIWNSEESVKRRYWQLITEQEGGLENNPLVIGKGIASTRTGIALVNGGWEEFRDELRTQGITIEEVEKQFPEKYKGTSIREYLFKENAVNICHEIFHCTGLWHPKTFNSVLVDNYYKDIPNIMSYENMKIKEGYAIGYTLEPLQKKLLHSFIAGNNTYRAFLDSQRDLEFYLDNLAEANNLKFR